MYLKGLLYLLAYDNKEVFTVLRNYPSVINNEKKQVKTVQAMLNSLSEEVVFYLLSLGVPKEKINNVLSYCFSKNYNTKAVKLIYEDKKAEFRNINNKCSICGATELLEVHHIKKSQYFPELTYTSNNWITLCSKCHDKLHKEEPKIKELF